MNHAAEASLSPAPASVLRREHAEGDFARLLEQQTAKIPSHWFLVSALGTMGLSLVLELMGRRRGSRFVAQWPAPLLIHGDVQQTGKSGRDDLLNGRANGSDPAAMHCIARDALHDELRRHGGRPGGIVTRYSTPCRRAPAVPNCTTGEAVGRRQSNQTSGATGLDYFDAIRRRCCHILRTPNTAAAAPRRTMVAGSGTEIGRFSALSFL